jgi:UDP-N-acetylmuramoyl-L-alanyl-D-glutamate--2,6-diaminopimelate ligase
MSIKSKLRKFVPKSLKNIRHLFYAWYGAIKYKHPSDKIRVIGVTGTSGKSSTIFFLKQVLEASGLKVGALSTIEFCTGKGCLLNDRKMTMLGKMEIQKYLREMVDNGCDVAIIETTSEGRLQHRHRFINYDMMVLTNLYPEHIDAHGSFVAYKQAKLDIFKYVSKTRKQEKISIVNDKSEYKDEFLNFDFDKKLTFKAKEMSADKEGLRFKVEDHVFHPSIYGEYNAENLSAVIAIARQMDIDWNIIQKSINNLLGVPGRLEFIKEAEAHGFRVIVDYAFEPIAMDELYKVVKILEPRRTIHVFGSTGGGRDVSRRTTVGIYVGEQADICIVTDEDPYDDDPQSIIDDVALAVAQTGKIEGKDFYKILDRSMAIKKALSLAEKDDIILISGKGSEQKMCLSNGRMVDWDDRTIVRQELDNLKN